jgi:2-succinyl-6-hydroxy-2,4-cyclohexadiene-1-carboxylate synthase
VLVHGFTQTGRSWGRVADDLATDHEVVLPDAPGHGGSALVRADLWRAGELLGAFGPATFVGYSMGGRCCLHTALRWPERVERLVLLGATAGIDDDGERAARRASDDELADSIERDGVDAFLARWLAQPLFARLPDDPTDRATRATNTAAGLASSLRLAGTGTQEPTWHRLGALAMPVLVLAGALDTKFVALGERLAAGIGANATFATVPDAGHAAHAERPATFLAIVRAWLALNA